MVKSCYDQGSFTCKAYFLYGEMTAILNEIAEQFLVALVVPVTIQALSVLLIALLMDAMLQFQAVETST